MHDYVRAKHDRILPSIFFITLMVIGNLFLMNLFLAILLKNFEDSNKALQEEDEAEEKKLENESKEKPQSLFQSMHVKLRRVIFKTKDNTEELSIDASVGINSPKN